MGRRSILSAISLLVMSLGIATFVPVREVGLQEPELLLRERAIHELTQRGATVIEWTFSESPDSVLVSFPLGALDRRYAREGVSPVRCGMSIRRYIEPPLDGPSMTDDDLALLLQIPDLKRVDLEGTTVSDIALMRVRQALPWVEVEGGGRSNDPDE